MNWISRSALLVSLLLSACSFDGRSAGTATDAENTVAGVVLDASGHGIAGVEIRLVTDSLGFTSSRVLAKTASVSLDSMGIVRTTLTDAKGAFAFEQVDSAKKFSLSMNYTDSVGVAYAGLNKGLWTTHLNRDSLNRVTLPKASVLAGTLSYRASLNSLYLFSDHFRVGVEGSGISISVMAGRSFVMNGIPAGTQQLIIYPADQYLLQNLLNAGIPLDSLVRRVSINFPEGDTAFAEGLEWSLPKSYAWLYQDIQVQSVNRMGGVVVNYLGDPVEGVEVRLITDSLGFSYGSDSTAFPTNDSTVTYSDSDGSWWLPVPAAKEFNVEFLKYNKSDSLVGVSLLRYLKKATMQDSLNQLDTVSLEMPATLRAMVLYNEEPGAWIHIGDHFHVGIKGTSRYMDVVAGDTVALFGLPSGSQTFIKYPGDSFLWPSFESKLGSLVKMVQGTEFVVFTAGAVLELQVDTYSLPTP